MSNQNPHNHEAAPVSDHDLCRRFGVECRIVSDVHDVDLEGNPIPDQDRGKWMVTTPAGQFPAALLPKIPLAQSEQESESLAVVYLMLRDRDYMLDFGRPQPGRPAQRSPAIPTPVYLAFLYDPTYWPSNDGELIYAADVIIEVDGKIYEQPDIGPETFEGTNEVVITAGDMFDDMTPMHSVVQHFYTWITGHMPTPQQEAKGS